MSTRQNDAREMFATGSGNPSTCGVATDLAETAMAIDCDQGRYGPDIEQAANFLQERMGQVSNAKLKALAMIARGIDEEIYSHYIGFVLFVWIREHLCSNRIYESRAQELCRGLARSYMEHTQLLYNTFSEEFSRCIIASRGLMEARALDRAASTEPLIEERHAWAATFRKGFVRSVLRDASARINMFTPAHELRVLALLAIRQDVRGRRETGIAFKKAAKFAKYVFKLLGGDKTGLRVPDVRQKEDKHSWHLLGILFNAACKFVAEDPLVAQLSDKAGVYGKTEFIPRPFLEMAICCFNRGVKWNFESLSPTRSEWKRCMDGDSSEHKRLCVRIGHKIETLAFTKLPLSQRFGFASLSHMKWNGSEDYIELAQIAVKEIEPVFALARESGGSRFGTEFQLEAFRALAGMTEERRVKLKAQDWSSLLSLLGFTGDDSFLAQNTLLVLQCPEGERQELLQRVHSITQARSVLRKELKDKLDYSGIEIDALLLAAEDSVDQLRELRRMILVTGDRLKSPVVVFRELQRNGVHWDELSSMFDSLADVHSDPWLLSRRTIQVIRAESSERKELCAKLVGAALSFGSVETMLDRPSLAHLTGADRRFLLKALGRVPREERYTAMQVVAPILEALDRVSREERKTAMEVIVPILETLRWRDARNSLDEVLRLPEDERVGRRDQLMRSEELRNLEGITKSHFINQTKRAVRQVMRLAQPDPLVVIDRRRILENIEEFIFSYFPGLTQKKAREVLLDATCVSSEIRRSRYVMQKRDTAVSQLTKEIRSKADSNDLQTLLSIRAEAPEIANAWRALAGDQRCQDHSRPLQSTKAIHLGLVHIGTLVAMVWTLIDRFPEHASSRKILAPGLIFREQADMRFKFLMALAQLVDESELQLVCSDSLGQRLCVILQGVMRYSSLKVDFTSPPQRFMQILQEFHDGCNNVDDTLVAQLQKDLCAAATTEEERSWYNSELVKYCYLTGWPLPFYL